MPFVPSLTPSTPPTPTTSTTSTIPVPAPIRRRVAPALITALAAGAVASSAAGQTWTVINMHPAGAVNSEIRGIDGATQVGIVNNFATAAKWTGSAGSMIALNPIAENGAIGSCAAGGRQGGSVSLDFNAASHAALWSGSSRSFVDLHPSDPNIIHSNVLGMDEQTQVGSYFMPSGGMFTAGRACMWTGTAASFVDLQPLAFQTGEVRGVSGGQQVGATFDSFFGSACMWSGTADSFVDLTPPDSFASAAQCTDGVHQYGVAAVIGEDVAGIFPTRWSGSAGSWESMGVPEGLYGEILATHGGWQAGDTFDMNSENYRATVWTSPGVFEDLQQYLPAEYGQSQALGIWRHGPSGTTYVVGHAVNTSTGQFEAVMWVRSAGVNLITSPAAPEDCGHGPGDPLTYTVRVLHAGDAGSGPVTLTVDLPPAAAAVYASATPAPTSVTAGQLVFDLPALAAGGGLTDVTITLTAVGAGADATITAEAAASGEVDPTNNTASATARIVPAPVAGTATAVFSTDASLATSLIPGGGGHFVAFNRPIASPSGNWWIVRAVTDQASSQNLMLVRVQTGGGATAAAQKGVTATSNGIVSDLFVSAEVNDAGRVAFGGNDNGPAASRNFVARTDGGALTDVARTGQPIPGIPGVNYSGLGGSVNLFNDGRAGFHAAGSPAGSNAYLTADGASVLAQAHVTQPVGADFPIATVLSNAAGTGALAFDASGAHSIYQADLDNGDPGSDQVIVADGTVVFQESVTVLPGMTSPVDGNNKQFFMGADGTWLVRGINGIAAETWVARGFGASVLEVVRPGDVITVGSGEHWSPAPVSGVSSATFFTSTSDATGRTLIGGFTDAGDSFTDSVLVYDGRTVVARENDPIDLDGDGQFDDGAYIRAFDPDSATFIPGAVLVTVSYRDAASALCRLNNASRGQAVIRVPLPPSCPADFNGDGFLDFFDYDDYVNCFETGSCPPGRTADFNGDGFADFFDYDDFVAAFEAGC